MNQTELFFIGIVAFIVLILLVNVLYNIFSDDDTFLSRLFKRRRRRSRSHSSERERAHERTKEQSRKRR